MKRETTEEPGLAELVTIASGRVSLEGELRVPAGAQGLVLFAHGSGSSRHSPRNQYVASRLRKAGLATLLFDLLSAPEEAAERWTRHLRFDVDLLAADWFGRYLAPEHGAGT